MTKEEFLDRIKVDDEIKNFICVGITCLECYWYDENRKSFNCGNNKQKILDDYKIRKRIQKNLDRW